jgi:methyl-accepting chemotaxis protein
MKRMSESMTRITHNSGEVQKVVKVIDDIAFQTNLLALNAAVEAARAGVHGKGFAVVAEEVRNLTARSAKAAQETTMLIETSTQETHKGAEVTDHTAQVLDMILEQVRDTSSLVEGIATASREQSEGVAQVTESLQQIDSVVQSNTASAEQSASASTEMTSMANSLKEMVSHFQLRSFEGA